MSGSFLEMPVLAHPAPAHLPLRVGPAVCVPARPQDYSPSSAEEPLSPGPRWRGVGVQPGGSGAAHAPGARALTWFGGAASARGPLSGFIPTHTGAGTSLRWWREL